MPGPQPPLTVGVDARLVSGERGGVEQVIVGLASGLSRLEDGDERYLFLVDPGHSAWIEPYSFGPCSLLTVASGNGAAAGPGSFGGAARRAARVVVPRRFRAALGGRAARGVAAPSHIVPASDGTIERAGVEVMHFPMQVGFRTPVPTIFEPHDLQHLHFPEFFSAAEIAEREARYRALCDMAALVVLMSSASRDDIHARYGLPAEKLRVIPGAAPIDAYDLAGGSPAVEPVAVRERFGLPARFALYPAKAWPHKNHGRLVAAVQSLRERGSDIPLIFTGSQGGRDRPVLADAERRGVADLVHFVGFVTPGEMSALYRAASMLVFPSLFEGWGLPILEAFAAGLPVACSTATCLPALTAGAAELFDATSVDAMAGAMSLVWQDQDVRKRLIKRGKDRAAMFTWDRCARMFRATYRSLGGRELTDEDRALLAAPPLA